MSASRSKKTFPPLPPLPCSSSLMANKENVASSPASSVAPASFPSKKKSRSKVPASRASSATASRKATFQTSDSKSSKVIAANEISTTEFTKSSSTSSGHRRRVLRYGETMEDLFLLSSSTMPDHVHLCESIVDGALADNAASWVQVLNHATENQRRHGKSVEDLIRLLRRATSRFSDFDASNESDVLQIWLQYAVAQAHHGSTKDARSTFRFIQNKMIGAKISGFYCKYAKLEEGSNNQKEAIRILKLGLQRGAKPERELQEGLSKLMKDSRTSKEKAEKPVEVIHKRKTETARSATTSSKRPKSAPASDSNMEVDNMSQSSMSTGTISLSLASSADYNVTMTQEGTQQSLKAPDIAIKKAYTPTTEKHTRKAPIRSAPAATSGTSINFALGSVTKSKSKFFSARLRGSGLKSADHFAPVQNPANGEEEEEAEDNSPDVQKESKPKVDIIERELSKPVPKYSKMDLSYMLNWEPKRRQSEDENNTETESAAVVTRSRGPALQRIDETTSGGSGSSASAVTFNTGSSGGGSVHTTNKGRDSPASDKTVTSVKEESDNKSHCEKTISSANSNNSTILSQCNADFLPLVNEKNILCVNNNAFVKLGVIGKGGSCKVYRALSKECSVVAIKKVKLANLDKKAIDGYANEIALLRRLRGNAAIIQMHDSEVDLNRKAIFVVMELGEVDLNHVLQQQALKDAEDTNVSGRASLNMNFIRLTWYQMLHCVHSIHEERIIHGDLKPANFLFVRGALKLIDFGIAKAIQSDDTTNIYRDSQIGTLNYMSPEAILDTGSGKGNARWKCGRASDIWSLGCILYQMVYGRPPFASLHMIQKLQAIVNPGHEISYPDDVDEAVVDAIQCCLQRQPEKRSPIVGDGGLLEHHFLASGRKRSTRWTGGR